MRPNGMDIAVLVILGVFLFLGWKKGLVKMGFRLISFGLSLGCAWALHPILAEMLQKTPLYERIFSRTAEKTAPATELPGILSGVGSAAGAAVAEYLTKLLLNGISFLLILLIARIVIFFLGKILNFVASLPVLGFVNRLSGMAIGLVEGMLVVWILLAAMVVIPSLRDHKELGYWVEQSMIVKGLYENNPVLNALAPEEPETGEADKDAVKTTAEET